LNIEEKHLDSDFRRNDVKMLCIVNKVIPAKAGAFRYPGAVLPGFIEQLRDGAPHLGYGT
jgi:hypothetical protein